MLLLENLGQILDICWTKQILKQESDKQIYQKWSLLETNLRNVKAKEDSFNKIIHKNENLIKNQQSQIKDLEFKINELNAFKLMILDSTATQQKQ